jgi:hypothetical protein
VFLVCRMENDWLPALTARWVANSLLNRACGLVISSFFRTRSSLIFLRSRSFDLVLWYLAGVVASVGVLGVDFSHRGICIVRNDACNRGDSDRGDGV